MLGEKKFLKSVIAIISLIFILVLINTFFRMSLPYLICPGNLLIIFV